MLEIFAISNNGKTKPALTHKLMIDLQYIPHLLSFPASGVGRVLLEDDGI